MPAAVHACSDDEAVGNAPSSGTEDADDVADEMKGQERGKAAVKRGAKAVPKGKAAGKRKGKPGSAPPATSSFQDVLQECTGHCGKKKAFDEFYKDQRRCKACGNDDKRFARICNDQRQNDWFSCLKKESPGMRTSC